jgi:hypothetical protein
MHASLTADLRPKRIRTEECEVLRVASLRSCVQPHENEVHLNDGTRLVLCRAQIKGVFAADGTRGTASTLMVHCPSCDRTARMLRKPYGIEHWGCRRCLPLIYPAQRRSGWQKGRFKHKPTTWKLAAICKEQKRITRLLDLQNWPPEKLTWDLSDLVPRRHLNPTRMDSLLTRLDALEHLRVRTYATALHRVFGIETTCSWDSQHSALQRLLLSTRWAMHEHWRQPTTSASASF